MSNRNRISRVILSFVLAIAVVGLSGTFMPSDAASSYVKALKVSKTSVSVKALKSAKVTATVTVKGKASKKIIVTSSNKKVATVTKGSVSKGKTKITIKGVKKGTATITVKTVGKNSKKKVIKKKIKVNVGYANVKSVSVPFTSKTIIKGKTVSVKSTVAPSKANPKVTYKSSNTAVATVSSAGKVKGINPGTATITVKTKGKNKSNAIVTKKIKITVKYASVTGLTVPITSKTLICGKTVSVKGTVAPSTADPAVTYTSSNTAVATVSSAGTVKAVKAGTATITVKTKGTNSSGAAVTKKIAITVKPMYTVSYGTEIKHVEFKINKDTTSKEELEALGYTVVGDMASKDEECMTATYTFNVLPTNLDELKQISLAPNVRSGEFGSYDYGMFGPMAATICAYHTWGEDWSNRTGYYSVDSNPVCKMIGYLGGPTFTPNNYDAQAIADALVDHRELRNAYFVGSGPSNNYTLSQPYKIKMYEGPYYIPAKETINGYRPETHMIFVEFDGADTERYLDVYKGTDGKWYSYNKSGVYKNLLGSVKAAW